MAQKKSPPPNVPLFIDERSYDHHPLWKEYFEQFSLKAETQDDATGTLADVVSKFNALIDKLQAAGVME